MRLAIISDIHGNSIALDAVLNDISGKIDTYLFLGDYAAIGHDPVVVIERVNCLSNAIFVRGNTDRYLTTLGYPPPYIEDVEADTSLVPIVDDIARSFAWTQGAVTAAGWLNWLDALPVEYRMTLPDGTMLLAVHAQPGKDEGAGLSPTHEDTFVQDFFEKAASDLVFVSHVHWHRTVSSKPYVLSTPAQLATPCIQTYLPVMSCSQRIQVGTILNFAGSNMTRQQWFLN